MRKRHRPDRRGQPPVDPKSARIRPAGRTRFLISATSMASLRRRQARHGNRGRVWTLNARVDRRAGSSLRAAHRRAWFQMVENVAHEWRSSGRAARSPRRYPAPRQISAPRRGFGCGGDNAAAVGARRRDSAALRNRRRGAGGVIGIATVGARSNVGRPASSGAIWSGRGSADADRDAQARTRHFVDAPRRGDHCLVPSWRSASAQAGGVIGARDTDQLARHAPGPAAPPPG